MYIVSRYLRSTRGVWADVLVLVGLGVGELLRDVEVAGAGAAHRAVDVGSRHGGRGHLLQRGVNTVL